MKNVLLMVLLISSFAGAQVFTEDFDYTAAQNLSANGWSAHSGTGTTPAVISASGLTYSGYQGSGIGNAANVFGTGEDVNKTFTRTTGDGLTLYMTALLNVTEASNSLAGTYFLHLGNTIQGAAVSTLETQFCARVFAKVDASGNVQFGASNTSTATYSSTNYAKNTTYLLIVKYVLYSGTDSVKMWIKSSGVPANETLAGVPDVQLAIDSATDSVNCVAIRQASGLPDVVVDGIRVGTTMIDAGLPVELVSFTAITKGRGVELAWKTATEVNNAGFEIERNVNGSWNKIGYVEGNGTTNAPKSYSYTDASAKGTVSYRLKQVDNDGKFEYSNVVEVSAGITAADYELSQNFPNPFNPNTNITFAMKNAEHVNVTVYNSLGQAVATLFNDVASANQIYTLNFDGKNLSSGTYFYSLRSATRNEVRKMLLSK